jgi:prevent-host-death family protein
MAISVTQFKAKCLRIVDEVQTSKRPVVISRHGRAAAKLVPIDYDDQRGAWHGRAKRTTKIEGDLMSTGALWHAED